MKRKALCTLLAAAAVAAGCGGSSDADAARSSMQSFLAAIGDGNAANCPKVLSSATPQERKLIGKLRVKSVKVSGNHASVTLDYSGAPGLPHGNGPSSMVKVSGAWKVQNIP